MTEQAYLGVLRRRVLNASRYSLQGLKACFRHEEAFRVEVILGLLLSPLAFWLGQTALEVALMLAAVILVLIVELLNSAVEAVVDRLSAEWDELAGRAKDMGSAAVMLSLALFAMIWGAVIWQAAVGGVPGF